jgi:predicted esterase
MHTPTYPEPHVVLPNPPNLHKKTLILLHGTSTSGLELADSLLSTYFTAPSSQDLTTLSLYFPTCKLIFPTGSLNPTTVFNGRHTHAWFDVHSFADRTIGEESQSFRHGLRASLRYLAAVIKAEIEILRKQENGGKVVLGGFSQGAAMAIILVLSGELERIGVGSGFGGVIGISGWLPLRHQIDEVVKDISHGMGQGVNERRNRTREFVGGYLELDDFGEGGNEAATRRKADDALVQVPILLGHGKADEKVIPEWGLQMTSVLVALGFETKWKAYDGLSHWWNAEEITDIAEFLARVWR